MSARDYFRGKRVAVIGLGPHGEMVTDIKFLIKSGGIVAVYDIRSEARLKNHLLDLRQIGLANYVCGPIPVDDLLDMDMVILSNEYGRDSNFLKPVVEKGIPVEYPESLFFRLAPPVTIVGIMGVYGKSTVLSILEPMLEVACAGGKTNFFVINPDSNCGILDHLRKIAKEDLVLMRLSDQAMKELHALRISPHVAIFTSIPSRTAYARSPFEILTFQTYNNYVIGNDYVIDATHKERFSNRAKMIRTKSNLLPASWRFGGLAHDRENAALALEAARIFKVGDEDARHIIEKWKPLKGHLELVKKVKNVEFYNDTASVSPFSTITGLSELGREKNLVLILGGAENNCEYGELYAALPRHVHTLITIPGSGTLRERPALREIDKVSIRSAHSLEEAVRLSLESSKKGDRVLFSPAFAACGFDRSRKERGDRFVRAVRALG